jgi:nucleoside-diphosphate-sugar epimerase
MANDNVLIIGCGYLGKRVAQFWREEGKHVFALTRSRSDELRSLGLTPIVGDILQPETLKTLPPARVVLYAVGFDRSSGAAFREVYIDGLRNVLDALPQTPERFLYVSSTGVYGQSDGEEIDENAPTRPRDENGQVLLEAERLLQRQLPMAIILRFAGIYGPGRLIRRAAVENGEPLAGDPEKWLNLIHVEDGARAVLAAEELGRPGAIYHVSDGQPVRRGEFYAHLAELLAAPPLRFESPSPGQWVSRHERGNRRIGNRKMREELRVDLLYPNYREGMRAWMDGLPG